MNTYIHSESSKDVAVLKFENRQFVERIKVSRGPQGDWRYRSQDNPNDKGDIADFMRYRWRGQDGQIRHELRAELGLPKINREVSQKQAYTPVIDSCYAVGGHFSQFLKCSLIGTNQQFVFRAPPETWSNFRVVYKTPRETRDF